MAAGAADISGLLGAIQMLGQSRALVRQRDEQAEARRASGRSALIGLGVGLATGNPYVGMGAYQLAQGGQGQDVDSGALMQAGLGAYGQYQQNQAMEARRAAMEPSPALQAAQADYAMQQRQPSPFEADLAAAGVQTQRAGGSGPMVGQAPPPPPDQTLGGIPLGMLGGAAREDYARTGNMAGLLGVANLGIESARLARGTGQGEPYTTIETDEGIYQYNQATGQKGPRLGGSKAKDGKDSDTRVDVYDPIGQRWEVGIPQKDADVMRENMQGLEVYSQSEGAKRRDEGKTLHDVIEVDEQGRPSNVVATGLSLSDAQDQAYKARSSGRRAFARPYGTTVSQEPLNIPRGTEQERDFAVLNKYQVNPPQTQEEELEYQGAFYRLAQPRMVPDPVTGVPMPTPGHDLTAYSRPASLPKSYTPQGTPDLEKGRKPVPDTEAKAMDGVAKAIPSLKAIQKNLGVTGRGQGILSAIGAWTGLDENAVEFKTNKQQMVVASQDIIKGIPSNWDVQNYKDLLIDFNDPPAAAKSKANILFRNLTVDTLSSIGRLGSSGFNVPGTWYDIASELTGKPIRNVAQARAALRDIYAGGPLSSQSTQSPPPSATGSPDFTR